MQTGRIIETITAVLAMAASVAYGQKAASPASSPRGMTMLSSPALGSSSQAPAGEIVREIDDPSNGDRWLLVHNANHPAGPGLLLLVSGDRIQPRQAGPAAQPALPIIRPGDRVIVEENTPIVAARLEAVAMGPALAGAAFNARLTIGGRVIRAIAIAPGRAAFLEEARR